MKLWRWVVTGPLGIAILLGVLAALAVSCVTNEAGRSQLLLISGSEEAQLGLSSFDKMKKDLPISRDAAANEMVRRVGERIKSVVNLPGAQWEFVVFESKEANAFCLPGGKIGVYTGILPVVKDDAGLATQQVRSLGRAGKGTVGDVAGAGHDDGLVAGRARPDGRDGRRARRARRRAGRAGHRRPG